MIRRPPRSTLDRSSAASDVYKRQGWQEGHDSGLYGPEAVVGEKEYDEKDSDRQDRADLVGAVLAHEGGLGDDPEERREGDEAEDRISAIDGIVGGQGGQCQECENKGEKGRGNQRRAWHRERRGIGSERAKEVASVGAPVGNRQSRSEGDEADERGEGSRNGRPAPAAELERGYV